MESIIERISSGKFWQFHGGIHPPEQKWLSNDKPIRPLDLPDMLCIPMQQHIGVPAKAIVESGDYVLKGQPLTQNHNPMAVPIHAPTSGTIEKIERATIPHPSAMQEPCIFLKPDGKDQWIKREVCDDFYALSREHIIAKIANAGIAGMGGAGFPTHIKVNNKPVIDFLIINAAECEPYITSDDLLMREHSPSIVDGIKILDHLLLPEHILIGIEDNKPEAIKALETATQGFDKVKICVLPTKYPTGGEKQLIKALTGKEVPSGVIPGQMGIVMQNVATCYAIADAVINDTPLIKRVVTVTGQSLEKPQNVWALLGTPVEFLLEQCGYQANDNSMLIMGGPMMGFTMPSPQVPIIKTSNCILAPSNTEIPIAQQEQECIRCGQCAEVCPSQLLPQELQWSAKAKDYDQLKKLNLFDCIDCGACAFVCPSQIPLVQYYRVAKAEIRFQQVQELKAEKAKSRFEARKQRLEREKIAREEKHRKAAEARRAKMNANTEEASNAKSAVAAALARVKAKKAGTVVDDSNTAKTEQKSAVAAAVARAKAKKAAQQAQQAETTTTDSVQNKADDKALVADAVARAKAKKLAKEQAEQAVDEPNKAPADDKKSRVAAAVAKAKAKKLAAESTVQKAETTTADAKVDVKSIDAQASETKVEEAVKPAQAPETNTTQDDKKARVAAAIAKAKAKKLAQQSQTSESIPAPKQQVNEQDSQVSATPADDKKARIAAAIAKAKAKKQQAENK
ncbi:electron transport complex subunit RsxC [Thalassotalea sp. LPB0316]|uniref:electron transport complex subunit RsxC n=1 Tax=Thalassotalea sp. LPB0316 TaxID=2769490 RepID=UPI001866A65C|nr:electron transport complex subunit RsxC [Thalassotalea sp. LPB0316]QOL24312.1 electron transport complex subunit RsxC [Thalassotalea sp. LPB0316]